MEVTIELRLRPETNEAGGAHVAGTARFASGQEHEFSGWMALLQLLEASLADDPAA